MSGHRTLTITRKGGKVVTIPLAPRTARAIDLTIGERTDGPVFLAADGRRLDRHGAGRIVRKTARRAGIGKTVTPHTLRHAFITAALDAGAPCATCKRLPRSIDLFTGAKAVLALDANGLRVLTRLGFADPARSYAASYRQAQAQAGGRLPATVPACQRARQLLRRHGRLVCRRTDPSCPSCPISGDCPSAGHPPPLY